MEVEDILAILEGGGGRAAPVAEAVALGTSRPEAVVRLALAVLERYPKGGTFLDAALAYLPDGAWPQLVERALAAFEGAAGGGHPAAESVLAHASQQAPWALHPHLTRIFEARPNAGTYYELYPWRESGTHHLAWLREVVERVEASSDARSRACRALLETRDDQVVRYVLDRLQSDPSLTRPGWDRAAWVQTCLSTVGLLHDGTSVRSLCRQPLLHLGFAPGFLDDVRRPPWRAAHPTWTLPRGVRCRVGGATEATCGSCGGALHRLLRLDPIPVSSVVTSCSRLELATCLSCLGWERPVLCYRHDADGTPTPIAPDEPLVTPQLPAAPLAEVEASLCVTPKRWRWQAWGLGNGRDNLNRMGGEPCWIQGPDYPPCPSCRSTMGFLMQLDSDLPTADGGEWQWGSGGILYGFWCDPCRVSAFLWQCT